MNTNSNNRYQSKYLPDVPEQILRQAFQLCKAGAFDRALLLVHAAGFQHFTRRDVENFYRTFGSPPSLLPPPGPAPEPENPVAVQLAHGVPSRLFSKIAQLPKDIRHELNTMLDEGATYGRIIEWLNEKGHPGINKANLSHWQRTGYREWLREAHNLEREAIHREWLFDRVSDIKPNALFPAMDQLFVSQMLEGVFGLDTAALRQRLADHPRDFIALYNAYRRLKHEILADTATAKATEKPAELLSPVKPC